MRIEVENPREMLGARVQRYLRWRFGDHAAKRAADITGADLRTARGWVEEGRMPREEALLAIIRDMGRDGLIALFSPEIEQHNEKLERQIHDLREEAARLEARLGKGRSPAENQISELDHPSTYDPCVNHDRDRRSGPRCRRAHP